MLTPKPVSATAIEDQTYCVFPNDLNAHGTVFGGTVMAELDKTAAIVALRHSQKLCVTAAVDSLHFLAAARQSDILIIKAAVNRTWRTSMEIGLKVLAENFVTRKQTHIISAYFTFVAVDDDHRPTEVPRIIPETPVQKRRYEEAELRRQRRREEADERKRRRAQS